MAVALLASCSDDVTGPVARPPECEIISPEGGSAFAFGESVVVRVRATDPDGEIISVTFYVNGEAQAIDSESPYLYVLSNLAYRIGNYSLKAVASDNDGLQTADTVEISITSSTTPVYDFVVKNSYDHDEDAFTQGLVFDGGYLYEGTGLRGRSSIRRVELETGEVLDRHDIPDQYFGEGITIWENKIYQLTWTSGTGFVYSKATLDSLSSFSYDTEGWGLTHDGDRLIMSDGTPTIYFRDPDTFELLGEITVTDRGAPVTRLNELEYINGDLFANVWRRDSIARISLDTGEVIGWINLENLREPSTGVLNGIAYDDSSGRLFVTGKNWYTLFEIELVF
jgi:glutamine cyclotransferase